MPSNRNQMENKGIKRDQSNALYDEAKKYFPGGVHSPVRAFKSVYGSPLFLQKGDGSFIWDVDGNKFIDFCCSWGPLILGHNDPNIRKSIQATLENGTSFGAPSQLGNELGKLIVDNHNYIDKIRFVSSGTEAVMSAIRLARGYTGKSKIIKFEGCYHGHVDSLMVKAGSGLATFGISTSAGIPPSFTNETIVIDLNDLQRVEDVLSEQADDIACMIIEPVPANNGLLLQDQSFLVWLRQLCDKYGVLLIFDEVISGFRVGFEGAAGYYSVPPDILTFGKIIGGGLPVGAYAGSNEIMSHVAPDGPVYQAGTLSANPIAMSAGKSCIEQLLRPGFYEDLVEKTQTFVDHINAYCKGKYPVQLQSIASIFWISFSTDRIISSKQIESDGMDKFKELHKYLLDHNVYLGPSGYEVGFISAAHTNETLQEAAQIICEGLDHVYK